MTYEEVAAELVTLGTHAGEHVYVVKAEHLDTTALHLLPFAWFIAFGPSGKLHMGVYGGPEDRLIARKCVAFSELTPQLIREEVTYTNGLAEFAGCVIDPKVLKALMKHLTPRPGIGKGGRKRKKP